VHFPATPPWRCYDTPPLPAGERGQITVAAVLRWETRLDWATVAEFEHDKQYAVKRHGGKELCGLQTKGLCSGYFMGEKGESLHTPYVYLARYDGSEWKACLHRIGSARAREPCTAARGPGAINATGVLRVGGSEPGSGYCNHDAMGGWLSELIIWNWAKTEGEMEVIRRTLLWQSVPLPSTGKPSMPKPGPETRPSSPEPEAEPEPELEKEPVPVQVPAVREDPVIALPPETDEAPARPARPPPAEAFAGAEFWFDAAELPAAESGRQVRVLPDKSGHGKNATVVEGSGARFLASAVHGRPAVHFPSEPPWRCYDTPPLPGGDGRGITVAAVLQWETREDWATVAEFRHDQQYALKRHGGKELCGLQTKGLCANYFMGEKSEAMGAPYVYTARYDGAQWRACLQEMGNASAQETCVEGQGPGAIDGSGVLRLGGASPGSHYCTHETMGGWLSEFIVWPLAKTEEDLRVIKTTLAGRVS